MFGSEPKHPSWAEVVSKVSPEFDQVWTGKITVDEAVTNAQKTLDVLHRFDAGIKIFNEEGETDSQDETD